ncbi:lipopolysaccharide biosynthesis protein [Candidatus Neomarinimicrobiota bacterium]
MNSKIIYIKNWFLSGHKRSVKAKKHIFYSFFIKGVSIIVGLILIPLILGYLDAERYGIWVTLSSIIAWFSFFDIGLGNGLRNRFAEAIAQNDSELAKSYVSTTYAILGIILLIVLTLFYVINPFLNWQIILNTTTVNTNELSIIALIVFTFFILRFFFKLIGMILMADQRPAVNNAFGPIGNVFVILIIFILTKTTEGSLILLSAVLSAMPVIVLIFATFYFFRNDYKKYKPEYRYIDFSNAKDLLGLGFKFFYIQSAAVIIYSTSNVIIAQLFGPSQVTPYNIAFTYFSVITMSFRTIVTPFWSAFTEAWSKQDIEWIKRIIKKLRLIWLFFSIITVGMLILANSIYIFWVGNEIVIPLNISITLAIFVIINSWTGIYISFLNGIGKIKLQFYSGLFGSILHIPLAIYFGKQFGVCGVVLSVIILGLISAVWAPIQYSKIVNNNAYGIWNA